VPDLRDPGPVTFEAELLSSASSGAACFVEFPYDLKALYGKGNLVPVTVVWDDRVTYRGSLARMGGSHPIALCRKDVLAQLSKKAGETVRVRVELDLAPRPVDVPAPLAEALDADEQARAAWSRLSASGQRAYADWIASGKRPETVRRRVEEALPAIRAGRRALKG
jgi:hypothetical protein